MTPEAAYKRAKKQIEACHRSGGTTLGLNSLGLAVLPPEIGHLTALKTLYLYDNRLTTLPPNLGRLTALEELYIQGNQLTGLPREIGQLTALIHLILSGNQLTALPAEIGQLTALKELSLNGNQLTTLPAEISRLTALRKLYIAGNPLKALPAGIDRLTALSQECREALKAYPLRSSPPPPQSMSQAADLPKPDSTANAKERIERCRESGATGIDLSDLGLTTLPAQIGQLTGLEELHLESNQLVALPPEIGQLTALRELHLEHNELMALPPEIGQLRKLTRLFLSGNKLASLQPEISQLSALTRLDLDYNDLTALAPEIGQLTGLTWLDLDSNQLTALPPEIGYLRALTLLSLNDNQLTALPAEIERLTALSHLYLDGNPLTALPVGISQLAALSPESREELQRLRLQTASQLPHLQPSATDSPEVDHVAEAKKRIEECRRSRGTQLNLSQLGLTALPAEIGQLTTVTELYLGRNKLSALPAGISQLTALTRLDLGANELSTLPAEIGLLTSLQDLYLQGNRLTTLPAEIGHLTELRELDLLDNRLSELPPEIGQLTALFQLYLGNNPLTTLPPEIDRLTNLSPMSREALQRYPRKSPPPVPHQKQEGHGHGEMDAAGFSAYHADFIGGRVAVGDALNLSAEVERLATLLSARETSLPLAVGLFGDWGSGKSHFMRLLEQRMAELAKEEKKSGRADGEQLWCSEVVTIRFNAWHYVDANLWANLVAAIFEKMFEHLKGGASADDQRAELVRRLHALDGVVAQATAERTALDAQKQEAEKKLVERLGELAEAEGKRSAAARALDAARDFFKVELGKEMDQEAQAKREEWQKVVTELGAPAAMESYRALGELRAELKTTRGLVQAVIRRWAAGYAWWLWLTLAAAVVAVPILAGYVTAWLGWALDSLKPLSPVLTQVGGLVLGGLGWLLAQVRSGRKLIERVEELARTAEAKRDDVENSTDVRARRAELKRYEQQEHQIEERVQQAQAEVRQIEAEIRELQPQRRIARFIQERALSRDYQDQLGLVSLARRDFERLSELFTHAEEVKRQMTALEDEAVGLESKGERKAAEAKRKEKERLGDFSKLINRIVLYVDDLDRCPPKRVVEVLQAVHLLLAFELFAVVVGVDQHRVCACLRDQFKELVGTDEAGPLKYLEKIFHIPFHLPAMQPTGFAELMESLVRPAPRRATDKEEEEEKKGRAGLMKTSPEVKHGAALLEPVAKLGPHAAERSPEAAVKAEEFALPSPGAPPGAAPSAAPEPAATAPTQRAADASPEIDAPPTSGAPSAGPEPAELETTVATAEPARVSAAAVAREELKRWEETALGEYHALVQNPRAAKRFLNTYRLVRAGQREHKKRHDFLGDASGGEHRVAMLLLAAAAGFPSVAREWLTLLSRKSEAGWAWEIPAEWEKRKDWLEFAEAWKEVARELQPETDEQRRKELIREVERFIF